MSVTRVSMIGKGRRVSMDTLGLREYEANFLVFTDSYTDNQVTILGQIGNATPGPATIPSLGTTFNFHGNEDLGAKVVNYDVSQEQGDKSSRLWMVTVRYSSSTGNLQGAGITSPTARLPRYSFGFAQFTKVLEKDLDDKPVVNSAGMPFDEPVEIDQSRPLFRVSVNISVSKFYQAAQLLIDYQDAINSDVFWNYPAKTVKLQNMSISEIKEEQGVYFHSVDCEFSINRDEWQPKVANRGRITKVLPGTQDPPEWGWLREASTGDIIADPVALNANGTGVLKEVNTIYLPFKGYKELPFNPVFFGPASILRMY